MARPSRSHRTNPSEKLPLIDLVRGFSILAVLSVHLGWNSPPPATEWLKTAWYAFATRGSYGVTIFFVISGFLITRVIDHSNKDLFRPDMRDFYARRAGRILPLLLFVLLLGALLLATHPGPVSGGFEYCFKYPGASFGPLFWLSILAFCFNWYRIFQWPALDGFGLHWDVLWSLSIEEQFYVFYPWILRKARNTANLVVFLLMVVLLGPVSRGLAYAADPKSYLLGFTNSFAGFDGIALGILLYVVLKERKAFFERHRNLCGVLCLLGFLIAQKVYLDTNPVEGPDRIYSPTLLGLGVFLFLLGGLHLEFARSKWVEWLGFPGKLSYGMYLLHGATLYFIAPLLYNMTVVKAFLAFAAVVTGVCWLSYRFFEVPANRWIRQKINPTRNHKLQPPMDANGRR